MRIAIVEKSLCKPNKCGHECIKVCPRNRAGDKCVFLSGEPEKSAIDEDICIGCGLCVKKCPFKAIQVVNTPEKLKETPIHRFGKNGFVLFRLPYPMRGEVVGLLGPNAVGKTTALGILSSGIKPNLGKNLSAHSEVGGGSYIKKISASEKKYAREELAAPILKDIIKIFRGTELQKYLEKMEKGEIKAVVKPQKIDILSNIKGTVVELLDKYDERKKKGEIIKKLNLENCLDRRMKQLSGGELQRVAIAVAASRKADIYYIDEPSSYLDVYQRLQVAKLLRELAEEADVIVVEHDLATLDFLADRIHIFYGIPGAYGIVSKPYSTRVGINTFLDGYIKEDNVRIRKEPIDFNIAKLSSTAESEKIIEWGDMEKKFESFKLSVKEGCLFKGEILGIFGSNGLGKTTFAKILAGELKADMGEIFAQGGSAAPISKNMRDKNISAGGAPIGKTPFGSHPPLRRGRALKGVPRSYNIKISYKPQYITTDFEGTVAELLMTVSKNIHSQEYKTEIVSPLDLEKLMEMEVKNISGGQLQRVAIALCLSKKADFYLLDEPSAFLDSEQRLITAKVIRKFCELKECSAMVIDHDLLFLSYLSDRAMVFSGKPSLNGIGEQMGLQEGFNKFLKEVGISFRADKTSGRPRANKLGSQKDQYQKKIGKYFYVE